VSLPLLFGWLTLAPALCALLIAVLGVARYALKPLALALGLIGLVVPVVLLLILLPSLSSGTALFVGLFGGSTDLNAWFSAVYRLDGFGLYAALGIAVIVAPLLFWMAWRGVEAPVQVPGTPDETTVAQPSWQASRLTRAQWGGAALALVAETAALTLVFADNIAWLALCWVVLTAIAWGIGELGSDLDTVDRIGLALMLLGPILWTAVMLVPAIGQGAHPIIYPRLTDMMGRGALTPLHVLLLAIALTLAGAGYPFLVWMRRRALLVTPAGLAALVLIVLPVALIVGARTYSAAQDASSNWQEIGKTAPPITAGIWFCLLGMLTICVCGLLALGRRDSRTLIAYLAVAQVGWGLLALGAGSATSMLALVTLLATSLFGLGAMLMALFAGGRLTSDIEPEGAGPQPFGVPAQPVYLAAWIIGALTLLGAPLFGGFVARQIISSSIIQARGLAVPLAGISWAGDALLALALLRATAPAFTIFARGAGAKAAVSDGHGDSTPKPTRQLNILTLLPQVPVAIIALLAILVGALPQVWLNIGGLPAASALVQPGQANAALSLKTFGYLAGAGGVGQWVPSLAWVALLVLALLALFALPGSLRETRPVFLAGASGEQLAQHAQAQEPQTAGDEQPVPEEVSAELAYLPEPVDTWSDIGSVFTSAWLVPLGDQLLRGVDDELNAEPALAEETEETEETDETGEGQEAEADETAAADVTASASSKALTAAPEAKKSVAKAPEMTNTTGSGDKVATGKTNGANGTNATSGANTPKTTPAASATTTPKVTSNVSKQVSGATSKPATPVNTSTTGNNRPANPASKPQQQNAGKPANQPNSQNKAANVPGKPANPNVPRNPGGAANRPQSKKSGAKKGGKGGGR
jgi:formate hydrogenlyase subunit 3/multisubunit Na+/H+ antiporter MnhD subunit